MTMKSKMQLGQSHTTSVRLSTNVHPKKLYEMQSYVYGAEHEALGPSPRSMRMPQLHGSESGWLPGHHYSNYSSNSGPHAGVGSQVPTLLTLPNQPSLMARRWSGQWDQGAIDALQPEIARCTRKQIKAVLGHIGRITCATTTASWRDFILLSRELTSSLDALPPPTPTAEGQMSSIDWDPRLGEDLG